MNTGDFRGRFCAKFGCPRENFVEQAFWKCLYPHAIWLAKLIWKCNRAFFQPDFDLIEQVQDCLNQEELREEIGVFWYQQPPRGFLRGMFRVRVSGHRLLRLGAELFT